MEFSFRLMVETKKEVETPTRESPEVFGFPREEAALRERLLIWLSCCERSLSQLGLRLAS
jgi:hypothetical protein